MLSRLKNSLTGRADAPPAPGAGVAGVASVAPVAPSVYAPPVPAAVVVEESDDAARERWQAEVLRRCGSLRAMVSAADLKRTDVERMLAVLESGAELSIRQPPAAAQAALRVARNPDRGLAELTRLVEKDPVLTQALLRQASSAMYATSGGTVLSLDAAVNRLGAKGVQVVVLSVMVESLMGRPGEELSRLMLLVWEHMGRTAPLARALAPAFDAPVHEVFVVGLLHDAGKLALFDRFASLRTELRRDLVLPAGFVEAALSTLHEPLGGLVMQRWGMNGPAAQTVASHHRSPPVPGAERMNEVVYLAERLDLALTRGTPVLLDQWWQEASLTGNREKAGRIVDGLVAAGPDAG
jgi:HD-like signal output (HDOD) protein